MKYIVCDCPICAQLPFGLRAGIPGATDVAACEPPEPTTPVPYLDPFDTHREVAIITPAGNGGFTVTLRGGLGYDDSTPLGAFTNTADLLVALNGVYGVSK